ncbi:MAG: hypothetical protein F6K55_30250 [Moorea sp. SIO4A3]|nr:hypothetical protein [Moorena sp. SIO4A3]
MSDQEIRPEAQPLIDRSIEEKTKDFLEIGRIAGLNTTSDCAGADLSGANLSSINLSRVNLSGANLRCAILGETNLSKVNLSDAKLEKPRLVNNVEISEYMKLNLK